jgi:hypothetical protein
MTGPEHYREAERLVRLATIRTHAGHDGGGHQDSLETDVMFAHDGDILAAAQVHATLALAAAQSTPRVDTAPGPCPINSPAGPGYPQGETCVWMAGHLGLHSRAGTTWNHGIDQMVSFSSDAGEF